MATRIFSLKNIVPTERELNQTLGDSVVYLEKVCDFIDSNPGGIKKEWKFYSQKSGWILKLYNKNRNLLFLIPHEGFFSVSLTFGERAFQQIMIQEMTGFNKQDILNAPKYVEGRTILVDIKQQLDCDNLICLLDIKLKN